MKKPPLSFTLSSLIMCSIPLAQATILADFDGKGLNYVEETAEGDLAVGILPGGPTGSFYQLLSNVNGSRPFFAFDSDDADPDDDYTGWSEVSFKMDFRAADVLADGFGINFLDTSVHGHSGAVAYATVAEQALIPASFGVGFKTFQSTDARVTYDGVADNQFGAFALPAETWGSLEINLERNFNTKDTTLDVTLYDQTGQAGNSENVFTDFEINNFEIEDFRVQIGGRTGGSAMTLEIDNIELDVVLPDPTDNDGDGMPTAWETRYGLDGNDSSDASADPDQDTLTNLQEYNLGTNPTKDDTDDDGFKDNVEDGGGVYVGLNQTGTDPANADSDDDGLKDGSEIPTEEFVDEDQAGTDPNKKDTDEDGVGDGDEIAMGRNPAVPDVITPITPVGGLLATFEEGGGAFESGFHRAAPTNANVLGTEGGDSFWHLLHNGEGSGGNYVSIASTGTGGWSSASFTMDLRASGVSADGFSVGFLDVATHGASGVTKVNSEEERGLYDNSIGVGFRTFNGTNATVNYSGAQSGDVPYSLPADNEWGSLQIDLDRGDVEGEVLVSATMFNGPGQTGLASDVFDSYSLTGVTDLDEFRMQVAGRTGGASMNLDIDNLRLLIDGVSDLTDDDGDGLPTAWETRYGLDGDDSSDASGDPDQDTLTNLQEYN
ncbi:MAG: hypothetical protein ACKVKH_17915, partial [Verrucomicrobiales bacterium]